MKKIFLLLGTLLVLASGACGYFLYQNKQLYHDSLAAAEAAIEKKDYRNAAINVERALFLKKNDEEALAYKAQLEPALALKGQDLDVDFVASQSKKILRIPKGSAELKAQARAMQEKVAELQEEKKAFHNNLTELQAALRQNDLVKAESELTILNKACDQAAHLVTICQERNTLALEFETAVATKEESLQKELLAAKELLLAGDYLAAKEIVVPIAEMKTVKGLADIQLQAKKLQGIILQQDKIEKAM